MPDWLQQERLGLSPGIQAKLLITLLVVLGLWVIYWIVLRVVYRRVDDAWARYRWRKTSTYVAVLLGLFLIGRTWFEGVAALATFLGLLSAGLAIALKDLVANLAGWGFIIWRRPFEVGDRVQIGDQAGDVIDLRLFQFSLLEIGNWVAADQSTGRIIHIPNGKVFTEPVANYTRGFDYIWHEVPVVVTFESEWRKAKALLQQIALRHAEALSAQAEQELRAASQRFLISYDKVTPVVWTDVVDIGVRLTLRYLVEPRRRRASEQGIWEDVLTEFARHDDIDFAYPTIRHFRNAREGKPALRPAAQFPE